LRTGSKPSGIAPRRHLGTRDHTRRSRSLRRSVWLEKPVLPRPRPCPRGPVRIQAPQQIELPVENKDLKPSSYQVKTLRKSHMDTLAAYPPHEPTGSVPHHKPALLFAVHRTLFTIRCAIPEPVATALQSHIMANSGEGDEFPSTSHREQSPTSDG